MTKPPLRTDLRLSAETADGAVTLKNNAVLCAGTPLRVEMLDAIIITRSGSITGTALESVIDAGCSVIWEGRGGVLSFTPASRARRTDFVERQAWCSTRKKDRLATVRRMMSLRFGEEPPRSYTENEIRGWEGRRMAKMFRDLSDEHGVPWTGRENDPSDDFRSIDPINRALSSTFSVLYREVHLATLVMGMSPALGFLHRGDQRSFVFDMADIYKNRVVEEVFSAFADEERVTREWVGEVVRGGFVRDARKVLWG